MEGRSVSHSRYIVREVSGTFGVVHRREARNSTSPSRIFANCNTKSNVVLCGGPAQEDVVDDRILQLMQEGKLQGFKQEKTPGKGKLASGPSFRSQEFDFSALMDHQDINGNSCANSINSVATRW
eukprot:4175652-Pyramimonas_sp.AAC.2